MGDVIQMRDWLGARAAFEGTGMGTLGARVRHPAGSGARMDRGEEDAGAAERLQQAIGRLDPLVAVAMGASGRLQPSTETELLAILGAITMDLIPEAAERAERLSDRLDRRTGAAKG